MLALATSIKDNTVSITDDLLQPYEGKNVTILISENKSEFVKAQLNAIRTSTVSSWGEDAQEYIEKLRSKGSL